MKTANGARSLLPWGFCRAYPDYSRVPFLNLFAFFHHRKGHPPDGPAIVLPSSMPVVPRKERPKTPPTGTKRPAPDDVDAPAAKRAKIQTNGLSSASPSKGYKEVDGVLVVEDDQDDDVIMVDD
jgi:hypothetical protein